MKTLICLVAVTLTSFALVSSASAAEPNGNVDNATLASMGLSGLEVMSDEEGKSVRGTFAIAFGSGTSNFLRSTQTTGYAAGDFGRGVDFAAGGNTSQTGFTYNQTVTGPLNIPVFSNTISLGTYATGSSWAFAGR
ncbi:hypothetical protein [Blastopirellula retiformator]|uniref:Uncharacterized protein n=1 Tax=Blastopirellula retiformator TaxID=2527970 RepID=A0A5C5V290_9BACT|nr:hypothetical protein [Blastopirellula retiformator]TWT32059.1 hypothetical protein Enr8_39850 [Blastopirellula retiformator]